VDESKKSNYTAEWIDFALKQPELETSILDVCRKLGIAQMAFCRGNKSWPFVITIELHYRESN